MQTKRYQNLHKELMYTYTNLHGILSVINKVKLNDDRHVYKYCTIVLLKEEAPVSSPLKI